MTYMYCDFRHNGIIHADGGLDVDVGGGYALRLVASSLRFVRPRVLAQVVFAVKS